MFTTRIPSVDSNSGSHRALSSMMRTAAVILAILAACISATGAYGEQEVLDYGMEPDRYSAACPDYLHYSMAPQYV